MRLEDAVCRQLLGNAGHGVLGTVHRTRGVDLVPVVYVHSAGRIYLPIDTVKEKAASRLARVANLALDPRCALLVEQFDNDWTKLWWVRVHGFGAVATDELGALRPLFATHFPDHYQAPEDVTDLLAIEPAMVIGWAAGRDVIA